MSKNTQTAIEWLVEQLFGEHTYMWHKEIQKAKEMEKAATISKKEIVELSDEEIKEIVEQEYKRYPNNDYLYGHSEELQLAYKAGIWDGIKWYREQLKSRQ